MSSTVGAIETRASQPSSLVPHLAVTVWLSVVLLAACVAILLTWRRIVGALVTPLSGFEFVVAAFCVLLSAAALRRLTPRWLETIAEFALPGIAAFLLLAAMTLPGTPAWGMATAWLLFIAGESGAWLFFYQPRALRPRVRRTETADEEEPPALADEPAIPPGLVQQITRVREGDHESIHALFETCIAAGDRLGVAHLAFCPPIAARPELTAHAADEADAEIRVTQIETFGARLEVRFPQASNEPRRVIVEAIGSVTAPTES